MAGSYTQNDRIGKLATDLGKDKLLLLGLTATERLSESYTVTVEAMSEDPAPLHDLLGTSVGVSFTSDDVTLPRDFAGILWEYSELGRDDRGHIYRLVLRPQIELLTLNKRNRIFQKQSIVDIVKSLLIGTPEYKITGSYEPLEYCVQYQESDFEFFSRLLENNGIYYFYAHEGTTSKIVLLDERNSHDSLKPASEFQVLPQADRRPDAPIWSVTERRGIGPAKVSVSDYDFNVPDSSLLKFQAAAKTLGEPTKRNTAGGQGSAGTWEASSEIFHYPGNVIVGTEQPADAQKDFAESQRYSGLWLASHRRRMARSFADGALFAATTGRTITLKFENDTEAEYLIVSTEHHYTAPAYDSGEGEETFLCTLELMPADAQYRPAMVTPRPRIMGPQTAVVVGPAGEEIYTDKHGRIKVQFHWDREGKKDENSSCFIRVAQSVAGQSWGSFSLPRIGQEVVVEFLEGDPDRPMVTGAVYNASNTPPVDLPANKTQHGLRTRISLGGGGFSHWWYEDKKGEEVVWFRAERDYKAHIVHADEERQYDEGSRQTTFLKGNDVYKVKQGYREETIQGNDSKTILSGDLTDIVKKGDETHTVEKGKRTTTIEMDETLDIKKGNRTDTIHMGNDTLEIKMGNRAAKISMGNDDLKVALGNISTKADLGKISMEAMQAIELKVGGSSITIDQVGVKIKGTVMVDIKGVMVQSSGDAMHVVKGGIVMIN